jgi:hypothetical protein
LRPGAIVRAGKAPSRVLSDADVASRSYHLPTMAHMSNRDRIARAAEEARITAQEKAAKKTAKPAKAGRVQRAPKSVRMKVVWEVRNPAGAAVKVFAYPNKAEAEAEADKLSRSSGRTHVLRESKVPMD